MTAYVGIDLHRRRSLAVCMDEAGERLWWKRFENSPQMLAEMVSEAGPDPEVVMEATWGWYWAADVLADMGARVHLAHPLGIKGFENRRVKNDLQDAAMLANLLRLGSLPESWIAPDPVRQLRELVRYRSGGGCHTSHVWAHCEEPAVVAGDQVERPARSGPLRIDGELCRSRGTEATGRTSRRCSLPTWQRPYWAETNGPSHKESSCLWHSPWTHADHTRHGRDRTLRTSPDRRP